jgi:hypothetical protein
MNDTSPALYAKSLAYLSDPSTIRARVRDHFGRAPSLEQCARYRQDYLRDRIVRTPHGGLKPFDPCKHPRTAENIIESGVWGQHESCRICSETAKPPESRRAYRTRRKTEREVAARAAKTAEHDRTIRNARTADDLIAFVAERFNVTVEAITGRERYPWLTCARWMVSAVLVGKGWSTPRAGAAIKRDHTTVIYALKHLPDRCAADPWLAQAFADARAAIENAPL